MELNQLINNASDDNRNTLVQVRNLTKTFISGTGIIRRMLGKKPISLRAVYKVNLDIYQGEALGLIGESGCGKTTLGRCILRLYEPDEGQVLYDGLDILHINSSELRKMRRRMQVVFQDPYSSLNPRQKIGKMLSEAFLVHRICTENDVQDRVKFILNLVGLRADMANRLPHELSGGQRQRVGLARALAVNPQFIIADEPVSALDVSIQAQVVNLFIELQEKLHLTMVFITHDLRLAHYFSHRVAVMYLGSIVELGPNEQLFSHALHPYTQVLFQALPKINPRDRFRAPAIKGEPPSPINIPSGCPLHPRCEKAMDVCRFVIPNLVEIEKGHYVSCHLYQQ